MARWATTSWHVWVLLGLLDACEGLLIPRISFNDENPGRSVINFTSPGIENTTTLLLSDDGATLYVGARDAVLSLDVSQPGAMKIRSKIDWSPATKELQECTLKGKSEMDCHNFVRVLQFLNTTHIYACGTFAFNPTCTFINTEAFALQSNSKVRREDGRGRCPFDPHQRSTAIAVDGELYTGTMANFLGDQPVISRFLSERNQRDVKLDKIQGWLKEPTFISSTFIPSEGKVYYFFRETGMEYECINDYTVSRVAQVCKSDVGGKSILQKSWTTFAKAQLRCQADTELPFNIIQDMVTLPPPEGAPPEDTLFYGVFSSQWSVTSGKSAVCSFRLGDIKNVFAGNYKTLNRGTLRFNSLHIEKVASPGKCGLHNASDTKLRFVKDNFLAEDSVQPADQGLALVSPNHLYSRIVAQRTRAASGRDFTVLFLLTDCGFLHKTVLSDQGPHIIEEIQVFKQPQSVKNILLSITKGVVFVGSSEGVFQIPVSNCSFYTTCAQCVLARDPFCGWDPNRLACAEVASISSDAAQDVELGNVTIACSASQTGAPRPRFRSWQSVQPDQAPPFTGPHEKYVQLSEVVSLHCPRTSSLAQLHWERSNGSLDSNTFLPLENDGLSFLATPLTLGTYHCVAMENGYEETLAVITVKQRVAPRSIVRHHTPVEIQPRTTVKPSLGPGKEVVTEVWVETGREEVTEVWAETGREEVTEVWAETGREEVTEVWAETGREEVTEVWAETGREEVTEVWAETGREEVTEVWAETGREEVTEVWDEMQTPPVSEAATFQKELAIVTQTEEAVFTPIDETPSWSESTVFVQVQKNLPINDVKSYYNELLVVTFLLVVSLCMLMGSAAYIFHQKSSVKKTLQGYASSKYKETVSLQ